MMYERNYLNNNLCIVHYEVVHLKLLIMTLQTEENRGPVKIIQGSPSRGVWIEAIEDFMR